MPCQPANANQFTFTPEPTHIGWGQVRIPISVVCLIWGLMMLGGLLQSASYQWHAAPSGKTPEHWPASSTIARPDGQPVLLMFLHPHCPCSRASLAELQHLMARIHDTATVHIRIFASPEFDLPAEQSDAWKTARNILGASVAVDRNGALSRLYGAHASGTVVLYDGTGHLQFVGGITAGRGHDGTNPGTQALTACLNGAAATRRVYPVYGCPISNVANDSQEPLR